MRLPNAEQAVVDLRKLRDYALNPDHSIGKHKARVFAATLGLTSRDAEECATPFFVRRAKAPPKKALPIRLGFGT